MENCEHEWSSGHLWMVAHTVDPFKKREKPETDQPKPVTLDRCLKCGLLRLHQEGTQRKL
jgi:hypothetical protein